MADETRVGLYNLSGTDPTKAMGLIANTADVLTATPLSSLLLHQAKAAADVAKTGDKLRRRPAGAWNKKPKRQKGANGFVTADEM